MLTVHTHVHNIQTMESKLCERCGSSFERNRKYSAAQWSSARFCSRRCGTWNLGLTKADDLRMAKIAEDMRRTSTGRRGWSKGLTKETHPSLAIVSRKVSEAQRGKTINDAQRRGLATGRTWAKGRTKRNCSVIANRAELQSKNHSHAPNPGHSRRMRTFYQQHPEKHPNAIVAKKTKGKGFTYIERCVAKHLDAIGITYNFNVRVGRFWPDFSIASCNLLIEADGEYWHRDLAKDTARDEILKALGWRILHLPGKTIVNDPIGCRRTIENALREVCDGAR